MIILWLAGEDIWQVLSKADPRILYTQTPESLDPRPIGVDGCRPPIEVIENPGTCVLVNICILPVGEKLWFYHCKSIDFIIH